MKTEKPDKIEDQPMDRSAATKIVLALVPIILGDNLFAKSSPELQSLCVDGCQFVESLPGGSKMFNELTPVPSDPATEEDCARLRAIRDAMNQALFDMCETCMPDGSCPVP